MRLPRVFSVVIALFILLPVLLVVPMSFSTEQSFHFPPSTFGLKYYRSFFASSDWMLALVNSLIIGLASTVFTLVLATPAAFALSRYKFSGRGFINVYLLTPLMVPHIALALGYYTLFANMRILGTHLSVILAHTALSIPVCFLIVSANLKGFNRNLERAAANLGANPRQVFTTVTLPLLKPGFMVAALFAFINSFDETTIALFISGLESKTLPGKMFSSLMLELDPVIAVVSTIMIAIVILFLFLGIVMLGDKRKYNFRRSA